MSLLLIFGGSGEQVVYTQPSVAVALSLRPRKTTLNAPSWAQVCNRAGWHAVRERTQYAKPDEGITWTITTNWADDPTAATFAITDGNGDSVTDWYSSSTVTIASKNIALPKATIPTGADGRYSIDVSVEAGGRSPIIVRIPVTVSDAPWTHQTAPQTIRIGEGVAFALVTTPWGGSPFSVSDAIYNASTGDAATLTMLPNGSTSADGDNAVMRELIAPSGLAAGRYKAEISFTSGAFDPAIAVMIIEVLE